MSIVPDDASALDADRWRYYEELSRSGTAPHAPDAPKDPDHPTRWRDGLPWYGFVGSRVMPVAFMAIAVLAMLGSLALAFVQRTNPPAQTAPLSLTDAPVGQVGGLLPSAAVAIGGQPRQLRDIRPALVVVPAPGRCGDCELTYNAVAQAGREAGVRTLVALPLAGGADAAQIAAAQAAGATVMEADRGLFDVFDPAGTTVLSVRSDGTVSEVFRSATPAIDVTAALPPAN
ncbi:MAG: hypothetical protein ACH36H_10050 [Candidatus Nanopelagicales bacterium]